MSRARRPQVAAIPAEAAAFPARWRTHAKAPLGDLGVIELKLALRNTGSEELSVAASDLMLDALRTSEALPGVLTAAETGTFRVAAGSDRRLFVHFVLPRGVSPYDVTGFALQWRIRSGTETFERRTIFRQEQRSLQVPVGIPQVTMPGPG